MIRSSTIEISKSALKNNLEFLRNMIGNDCRLSSVVKGNAYGHGLSNYIELAEQLGVDHFSVFSAEEAEQCSKSLKNKCDIMIMGFIDEYDLEWAISEGIQFFVFDLQRLESALEIAKKLNKPARIHIELDTGMNRTGYTFKDLGNVEKLLTKNNGHAVVEGVCTHLAGAESIANHVRVQQQLKNFSRFEKWLTSHSIEYNMRHAACSAAATSYPKTRMDLARIGIMQYGFWPSKETLITYMNKNSITTDPLKQIMSWKSRVMSLHRVNSGEFVGYGTSYLAENDMLIAIIPVGYSQGYSRSLSNQGRVLVQGQRMSVIGLVNMNMLIIDVTNLQNVNIDDEVVLIGKQGEMGISVSSFSEYSNQLNYEMLTRIPERIPRKVVD